MKLKELKDTASKWLKKKVKEMASTSVKITVPTIKTPLPEDNRANAKFNCLTEKQTKQAEAKKTTTLLWSSLVAATILIGIVAWATTFFAGADWQYQLLSFSATPIILNSLAIYFGWEEVEQNEEWIILLFGKWFTTWEAGLHIKFPFFMFIKSKVPMYTQSLRLYMDGRERDGIMEAKINFKNTTSAVTSEIFFRIYGSHRATFEIDDPFKGIREKTDAGFRSYYGKKELDQAIEEQSDSHSDDIITQRDTEADKFKLWGIEIEGIAVTDIAIPEEIQAERDKIIIAEKARDAALIAVETARHVAEGEREAAKIAVETAEKKAEAQRITQEKQGLAIKQEIENVMKSGLNAQQAAQYLLNKVYFEAIKANKGIIISGQGTNAPIMGAELAAALNLATETMKP